MLSEYGWVSIVALVGWLVLAGFALRGHRIGWRKGLVMAFVWGSIFLAITLLFTILI